MSPTWIFGPGGVTHRTVLARAGSKRHDTADSSGTPPSPPTVAPSKAPHRKPKERSAYRQRKRSAEELQQLRETQRAATASAGRTQFLDSSALQQRHAAAASLQSVSRALLWSEATQQRKGTAPARLLLIDGYNLLYYHASTKQEMHNGQIDTARSFLHRVLRVYAAQQNVEVIVVYDATSLRGNGNMLTSFISDRVSTLFQSGQEADTVIIDYIARLSYQIQQQTAAGVPPHQLQYKTVIVHSNDNRIAESCNAAALTGGLGPDRVFVQGVANLSRELQQVENKLSSQHQGYSLWDAAVPAFSQQPSSGRYGTITSIADPSSDVYAWAQQYLAKSSGQQRQQQQQQQPPPFNSVSRHQSRTRRQQQLKRVNSKGLKADAVGAVKGYQEDIYAELLALGVTDEELLQKAAAVVEAAAAQASSVLGQQHDSSSQQQLDPCDVNTAAGAASDANAGVKLPSSSAFRSGTSQQLDALLLGDLDELLAMEDI